MKIKRSSLVLWMLGSCAFAPLAEAQFSFQSDTPPVSTQKEKGEASAKPKAPTEITSTKETTFDEKTRTAIFIGTVTVKDPEFLLTCDKLTAILRKAGAPAGEKSQESGGSGLETAVAEGSVVIVQEKPDEKGKMTRYVGKSAKMEYNAITGDVTLRGWPQIQQGINKQVATEEGTIMILNKNGRLRTIGASKTEISESTDAPPRQDRTPKAGTGANAGGAGSNSNTFRIP